MKIIIRGCVARDREAVLELWRRCELTRPWNNPDADFNLALSDAASTLLGGFQGDKLTASVMVGFDGHRGWVYYLGVDETYRRQGLGRDMMHAAEAWLIGRGAPKLQLMVREENEAALGFYERLGLVRQPVVTLGRKLR